MHPDDRARMLAHLTLHGWQAIRYASGRRGFRHEDGQQDNSFIYMPHFVKMPDEGYRPRAAGWKVLLTTLPGVQGEWSDLGDELVTLAYEMVVKYGNRTAA